MEEKIDKSMSPLIQAIAAVLLTAVGYASSYFFESGYLSVFGIDMMFTQVTLSVLVIGITTSVLIGVAMWILLLSVFNLPTKGKPVREYFQMIAGIFAILFLFLIIFATISNTIFAVLIIPVIGFCLFSILTFFLAPLYYRIFTKRPFKTSIEGMFGRRSDNAKKDTNKSMNIIFYSALCCIAIATSFSLGRYGAMNTSTFGTINRGNVCYAVIRKYGDELITNIIKKDGSLDKKAITILKISDGTQVVFVERNNLKSCR